jgi:outer membrane lipoprotein-sorting protein
MFILGISTYAQQTSVQQLFQTQLQEKNADIISINCRFKQTRQVSYLANPAVKEGDFSFTKPNDILLAFDDGDYIKMTSEYFEMKTAGNVAKTKVNANPMLKNLSSILSTCVLGDFEDMSAGFDVDIKQSETEWVATLTPKQSKVAAKISSIIISFDKSDMSLNLLKMVEKSGDYTAYTFTNNHETRK